MFYRENILIVFSLLMYPALSFSASTAVQNDPDLFSSLVKVFSILFIILAMLFVSFYLTKGPLKDLKKKIGLRDKDEIMKVLNIASIAPKKSIGVLDVAGQIIVVGITANDIVLLARLDDKGKTRSPESGTQTPLLNGIDI